jgi:hypothetical protein
MNAVGMAFPQALDRLRERSGFWGGSGGIHPAGAKAHLYFQLFAARLKSCPFKAQPLAVFLLLGLITATGCHSYHIDATVENHTGTAIKLLEVDYPSASFGKDVLAAGDVFHYRIQLRGNGPLKVQFTSGDGRLAQIDGPSVAELQEGTLRIVLLPGGRAEFFPQLSPAR